MATRRKTTAKKNVSRTTRRKASVSRLGRLTKDLPPTLRDFAKQVRARLNRLEQRIDRVQVTYRNQVAHLIRVASHRIDQAEPVRKQVIRKALFTSVRPDPRQRLRTVPHWRDMPGPRRPSLAPCAAARPRPAPPPIQWCESWRERSRFRSIDSGAHS